MPRPGKMIAVAVVLAGLLGVFYLQGGYSEGLPKLFRNPIVSGFHPDPSICRVGGFIGVYMGMYATGNGKQSASPADFDWFEYDAGRQ